MASALDLHDVAVGARGVHSLQVEVDDLVRVRYERPARLFTGAADAGAAAAPRRRTAAAVEVR